MKLADKIVYLRKRQGMTQEALAEGLCVSRQAVSRWESGSVMPDAENILQISKLFGVTTDYLLNDHFQSDDDLPKVQKIQSEQTGLILFYLTALEIMVLLVQFMTTVILQNGFFALASFLLFVAAVGGFEFGYRKNIARATERTREFRRKYYKISAWLGVYFPTRFCVYGVIGVWPREISGVLFEIIVLAIYIAVALSINLSIDKHNLKA